MTTSQPFRKVAQPDVSLMEQDGVAYRLYVWLRSESFAEGDDQVTRAVAVEAMCFAEQEHGQSVLVFHNEVAAPSGGTYVDCPRVVSRGSTWAVHWIQYDPTEFSGDPIAASGRELHRATMDMSGSTYAWTQQGSVSLDPRQLYDVYEGPDTTDYLLTRCSAADSISMRRVNGDAWANNAWTFTFSTSSVGDVETRVLACAYVHDSHAVAAFQIGTSLYMVSCRWENGGSPTGPTAITVPYGDFLGVGLTPVGSNAAMFVVAEYTFTGTPTQHELIHGEVANIEVLSQITGAVITKNLNLCSKPWSYAAADSVTSPDTDVYAFVGYQGTTAPNEWDQSNYYVVRFARAGSDGEGRPIPVGIVNQGLSDASPMGQFPNGTATPNDFPGPVPGRRLNHLSQASPAPSSGPLLKSRTAALVKWTRIDTARADDGTTVELVPAGAGIRGFRYHHEDPWLYHRDDTDPAEPSRNFASVSVPMSQSVQAGAGTFLGGAMPSVYDGRRIVEAGFAWYPEITDVTFDPDDNPAVGVPDGVYQYTVVAEWRDARGQAHRSRPSIPVSLTIATGDDERVEVTVRTMTLSLKDHTAWDAMAQPIRLRLYRTVAGGSIFYPIHGHDSDTYQVWDVPKNDPALTTITIEDDRSDTQISASIPLAYSYISGAWSPLVPEPLPAMSVLARWKNRVWGVMDEQPNVIAYSLEILPEQGGEQYTIPEFNAANTLRIDGAGKVTAMQELDNSLIVFTRDRIYSMFGEPNDGTGSGATLQLQVLQENTGCVEPRSIAVASDGIYFQSRRGFYKLGRANGLEYIGADVEDELRLAGNIRAVTVHEDSHQVRLAVNDAVSGGPVVLVYDTLMQVWTKWPMPSLSGSNWLSALQDAVVWRGHDGEHAHVVLAQGGLAVQRSSYDANAYVDESALDSTVAIPIDVRTGWIKMAGVAGFKRVRKIGIQLSKATDSGVRIDVEYDRDGSYTDGANLQQVTIASPAPEYIELRTNVQKCSAIRVRVYEDTGIPQTDTLAIHSLTLVVARKTGTRRVAVSQRGT